MPLEAMSLLGQYLEHNILEAYMDDIIPNNSPNKQTKNL